MPIPNQKTLGLLGGLGVGATVLYYEGLTAAAAKRGFVPKLVISHAHAPNALALVTAGRIADMASYLATFANQLAAAGADILAIPAITPHICLTELRQLTPVPFIDILTTTAEAIRARGARRIALMGTRFAIEQKLFGRLATFDVVTPRPDELDEIHRIYVDIATANRGTPEQADRLRDIARTLCTRDGVEAIVLAGTDLNLIFDEATAGFPAIDCAAAHIEAIADAIAPSV